MRWIPGPSGGGPPSKSAQPRRSEALSPTARSMAPASKMWPTFAVGTCRTHLKNCFTLGDSIARRSRAADPEDTPPSPAGRFRAWQHLIRVKVSRQLSASFNERRVLVCQYGYLTWQPVDVYACKLLRTLSEPCQAARFFVAPQWHKG